MKSITRLIAPSLAVGLALSVASVDAEAKGNKDDKRAARSDQSWFDNKMDRDKKRQVSGEIIKMKQVDVRGTDTKNTIVMMKTQKNDRRLIVDLGPSQQIKNERIAVGKKLKVEGQIVRLRNQPILVASRATIGNQTSDIARDRQQRQANER